MALSLLRLAERHYQQTVSFADGSRMGKRGPRRHRGIRVSLGKLAAGRASRLCQPLEKRAGASRSLCDKRIRALEHGRQRARMVRRLVRRQLLQLLSQSKSARTKRWHAKGFAGWFLDRKSTRLNSSHTVISYAVFCLKKKKKKNTQKHTNTKTPNYTTTETNTPTTSYIQPKVK